MEDDLRVSLSWVDRIQFHGFADALDDDIRDDPDLHVSQTDRESGDEMLLSDVRLYLFDAHGRARRDRQLRREYRDKQPSTQLFLKVNIFSNHTPFRI